MDFKAGDASSSAQIAPVRHKRRRQKYPPDPYLWKDGEFILEKRLPHTLSDWRLATQAGVYTYLLSYASQPRFFHQHFQQLLEDAKTAMLPLLHFLAAESLQTAIVRLLNRNMWYRTTLLRLVLFPEANSTLLPLDTLTSSLLIEGQPLPQKGFVQRQQGLLLSYAQGLTIAPSRYTTINWLGDPTQWLVQQALRNKPYSDLILLNTAGRVARASQGTLYMVREGKLFTPPLTEGACYDPIRSNISKTARIIGLGEVSEEPLRPEDLEKGDELFLASTQHGVEWVMGLEKVRYRTFSTQALIQQLNLLYFPDQRFTGTE